MMKCQCCFYGTPNIASMEYCSGSDLLILAHLKCHFITQSKNGCMECCMGVEGVVGAHDNGALQCGDPSTNLLRRYEALRGIF